jgi:hypothetical protein
LYNYLLGDGDIAVRIAASGALGHIGDDHAVEPLIAALEIAKGISESQPFMRWVFSVISTPWNPSLPL